LSGLDRHRADTAGAAARAGAGIEFHDRRRAGPPDHARLVASGGDRPRCSDRPDAGPAAARTGGGADRRAGHDRPGCHRRRGLPVEKRGVAYNHQGQRVGRPHVAAWAETAIVLAADLGCGARCTPPASLSRNSPDRERVQLTIRGMHARHDQEHHQDTSSRPEPWRPGARAPAGRCSRASRCARKRRQNHRPPPSCAACPPHLPGNQLCGHPSTPHLVRVCRHGCSEMFDLAGRSKLSGHKVPQFSSMAEPLPPRDISASEGPR
jgi:hypothetical protein